jgi:hypothetical protein
VSVPNSALAGGHFVLKKAKMFGVHTTMYKLEDRGDPPVVPSGLLTMMADRNVTFKWQVRVALLVEAEPLRR